MQKLQRALNEGPLGPGAVEELARVRLSLGLRPGRPSGLRVCGCLGVKR